MSLDHIWSSCPAYNIRPLIDATNTQLSSITPRIYIKYTDLDGSSFQWSSLLSLQRLDWALVAKWHQNDLKENLPLREWTYGCLLWHLWKCRNKEIYDNNYIFVPDSTLPQLLYMFKDFQNSY